MYKYFELDLKHSLEWNEFLNLIPQDQKDIYYTPEYYRLYENFGDGIAKCFVVTNGKNVAMYPFLMNEVKGYNIDGFKDIQGAYGYNGVIYNSISEELKYEFDNAFNDYCYRNKVLAEFTRFHPLINNSEFSNNRINVIDDRETVFLDLKPTIEEIWKTQFSSQIRNKIRKAEKRNYISEVINNPSDEDIDTFIRIYYENMEIVEADEYFYFSGQYFKDIFKHLSSNSYLMNIHDDEGEIISSTILLKYEKFFHYHLSGRTSNAISWASNFLYSESIKLAKKIGAEFYHFGGGRSAAPNDSLLRFKKGFSKDKGVFRLGKKIYFPEIYDAIEKEWNRKNPRIKEEYKNFLLKYRVEPTNKFDE